MLVVNLFGVPGAGKTCNAQYLAARLAMRGWSVEYVPELARMATYQSNEAVLSDQTYIFGVQQHYMHTYKRGGVDVVVSDSPLPNAFLYLRGAGYELFKPFVLEVFNGYENLNFFMRKNLDLGHLELGRIQSKEEALGMEVDLERILRESRVEVENVLVKPGVEDYLVERVVGVLSLQAERSGTKV